MSNQSYEHRLKRSIAQRDNPIWEHYEPLYKLWLKVGMPTWWEFKQAAVAVGYPKDYEYKNMVKWFFIDFEEIHIAMAEAPQIHPGARMFNNKRNIEQLAKSPDEFDCDVLDYARMNKSQREEARRERIERQQQESDSYYGFRPIY